LNKQLFYHEKSQEKLGTTYSFSDRKRVKDAGSVKAARVGAAAVAPPSVGAIGAAKANCGATIMPAVGADDVSGVAAAGAARQVTNNRE
jgi:hypothetical protein